MTELQRTLIRRVHWGGVLVILLLGVLVFASLTMWANGAPRWKISGGIVLYGLLAYGVFSRWLTRRVILPSAVAEEVAVKVSQGDLSPISQGTLDDRVTSNPLVLAIDTMVTALRHLVGAIQGASGETAALAQQIAASTQQMTASTHEIAGTTGELTERATAQADVIRSAADDASKSLDIAQKLNDGSTEAADRNMVLARMAQDHKRQ